MAVLNRAVSVECKMKQEQSSCSSEPCVRSSSSVSTLIASRVTEEKEDRCCYELGGAAAESWGELASPQCSSMLSQEQNSSAQTPNLGSVMFCFQCPSGYFAFSACLRMCSKYAFIFVGRRHNPRSRMGRVAGEIPVRLQVPVAIVVPEAQPRLQPQVVQHVQSRWIRPHQAVLLRLPPLRVADPEVLQEVHVPRHAVPPREDLVQVALVAAVVGGDLVHVIHQQPERAVGGLHHHDAGVEEGGVVPHSAHLRHREEEVDVPQHQQVGVDEHHLVVVGELPQPELAVVPLVVGVALGLGVADPLDGSQLPPCSFQAASIASADRFIHEDDEIPRRSRRAKALGCRDRSAHVVLCRVQYRSICFSFPGLRVDPHCEHAAESNS
ncbi:hypothetical protein C4D60_Mb07t04110 [Musa balbisiana]|uniref:Uncharacterized protein n=1 Tax=Musa balbisiana TaxID=52838 RepID=A0A4S8JD12_MUSBA|nr:hypothetical protein C4D60_Mb07t04110 [Musa balbisiana]